MKLLGPYNTKLQAFHYQELLDLYKQSIAQGEFSGNKTFDEAAITNLVNQSQNFSTLPLASVGQRVTDDSLNNPLNQLDARFNSLVAEANDFDSRAAGLIAVLEKDTGLLDQLLAGADLQKWLSEQPPLSPSTQFSWDYGMGNGPSSSQITQSDPSNSVVYPAKCPVNTYLDVTDGSKFTGLVAPDTRLTISAKNLIWQWTKMTSGEQSEALYGDGWAELNLLEDRPLINFLPNPSVVTILPSGGSIAGVFSIGGAVTGGSLPIYIRTSFVPRRNDTVLVPQNAISEPSFEAGGVAWVLGNGWTVQTGAEAHTGTKYASKAPFATWSSLTTYSSGNVVTYLGREYVSLTNSNLNNLPNAPGSTDWSVTGILRSPIFPLNPDDKIYVEGWLHNLAANGIVTISLVCLDQSGNELSPPISMPGVSSADDYLQVSEVLQALGLANVTSGRIEISVFGQTTGSWSFDDLRVHLPQNLSAYVVNQDDVAVYIPKTGTNLPLTMYFENEEFVIDDNSNITLMNLPDGNPFTIRFTENFPAYECSVNEKVWSPVIMLDPARPYPDTEQNFDPIAISVDPTDSRTLFPITDEIGVPTGLTLKVISRPLFEYYFQITTPAQPQYGATAILEIDLTKPTYMNGLIISPFSTYPIRIVKVETESFTTDTRQTVGAPNALIDRPMVLTFPTTLLRKIYLTCYQENYNLSEHVMQPPDALRRDTLFALQTVLPFNVRRPSRAVPVYFRGAQYVFGLENIAGINTTAVLPGIFISGPHHFKGCPDVYRFDASVIDPAGSLDEFDVYLCWIAYDSSGVEVNSELSGVHIEEGDCAVWPFPSPSLLDRTTIDHVDIFLKFVIRHEEVVLQRYLLQVSSV